MTKFAVAAALLSAIVATPALAADGQARVEVRGGIIGGGGTNNATLGAAAGYDLNLLNDKVFIGAEIAGDKVLKHDNDVQFSAGGRIGTNLGAAGKIYANAGYTFGDIEDPYVGAGYQYSLTRNLYAKTEYRHQFIGSTSDRDAVVVGVGFAF